MFKPTETAIDVLLIVGGTDCEWWIGIQTATIIERIEHKLKSPAKPALGGALQLQLKLLTDSEKRPQALGGSA